LSENVRPFKSNFISKDRLQILVKKSEVLNYHSDNKIFSTNINHIEDYLEDNKSKGKLGMLSEHFNMRNKKNAPAINIINEINTEN